MLWLSKMAENRSARPLLIAVSIAAVLGALYLVRNSFNSSVAAGERQRIFVDSTTGKGFPHELVLGETIPVDAPSGGKTGYPAELCYWNKDGTIKSDPTPVLLNEMIGKSGPTFCPDCGRLVVPHNPYPVPGSRPPPTMEEYEKRFAGP
jgi:hypothetical protein